MKSHLTKLIFALCMGAFSAFSNAATILDRSDFGPQAVEYGFDNGSEGDPTAGDGNLLVSVSDNLGQITEDIIFPSFTAPAYARANFSNPAGQPLIINLTFEDYPVAKVGFDYFLPKNLSGISMYDLSLTLFDDNNTQLGFYDLAASEQSDCAAALPDEATCGFFGLSIGNNNIYFASIEFTSVGTTPIEPFPLEIDNLIYSIPAPSVVWLIGLGLPGLLLVRKNNRPL